MHIYALVSLQISAHATYHIINFHVQFTYVYSPSGTERKQVCITKFVHTNVQVGGCEGFFGRMSRYEGEGKHDQV